jgi:hypothetical protein
MLEILKAAYDHPNALTQSKNYAMFGHGDWPKYIWDFYPIAQPYYHEFNPYFVHMISKDALFPEFKVFTVRDGAYGFGDFLLKFIREIPKWKNLFLIPSSYAPMVPDSIRGQFLSYSTSQVKPYDLKKAKCVTVFALMCDQYFGSYELISKKLEVLKDLPEDIKLEVCVAIRRNPLTIEDRDNLHFIKVPELIRKAAGNREIKWLRTRDLMEKSTLKDNVLIDLLEGQQLTCDNYLHFWFLSHGGAVHGLPVWNGEKSLFDIDLSLNQKMHVHPLPKVPSAFADLMFFAKTTKVELITYPLFHAEVNKALNSSLLISV